MRDRRSNTMHKVGGRDRKSNNAELGGRDERSNTTWVRETGEATQCGRCLGGMGEATQCRKGSEGQEKQHNTGGSGRDEATETMQEGAG